MSANPNAKSCAVRRRAERRSLRSSRRYVFSTDHRTIGRQYLLLALVAVTVGTLLSLLMRLHLTWPERVLPFHGPILPEDYLALVTFHGTLMVFFVLTTAPQGGFGNLICQARSERGEWRFRRLNCASFWLTAVAMMVLLSATLAPGGGPISGWTAYPPLSAVANAGPGQAMGMDLWLASLATLFRGHDDGVGEHADHGDPDALRRDDLEPAASDGLGMVHGGAALFAGVLGAAGRAAAAVLRPPRWNQLSSCRWATW